MTEAGGLRVYRDAVAVITGGASGIGRAFGETLARRGARVVLGDLQAELAEEVAAGIRSSGGRATAVHLDVTDFKAIEKLIQETVAGEGRLDFMFNNAGIGIGGEARYYQIEDWNRVIDINLRGVTNGIQAAYPVMVQQGFGHLVNTASMAGLTPFPMNANYAATKHAVVGLTSSLRIEAAPLGVRVSALCPGVIRTPILFDGGVHGKLLQPMSLESQQRLWEPLRPLDVNVFAERALRSIARNEAIIIHPAWWRVTWWLYRLSPAIGFAFARQIYNVAQKELAASARAENRKAKGTAG